MKKQIKTGQQKRTHGQVQQAIQRQRLVNLTVPLNMLERRLTLRFH